MNSDGLASEEDLGISRSQNSSQSYDVQVANFDEMTSDVFLIKLPNELIKYQKKHNNLSFNLNELKKGSRFKINNNEYEAAISKVKSSFSCLSKKDDSLQAVNSFKHIVQIKQVMEIPKPVAPVIIKKKVEVPDSVNSYLTKKNKKLKRLLKKKDKIK